MPARFVEVTNPIHVARNSDPLSYVPTVKWNVSAWGDAALEAWEGTWAGEDANSTSSLLRVSASRVASVLARVRAPQGPALWAFGAALVLLLLRAILLRRATRRVVSQYGHAHVD